MGKIEIKCHKARIIMLCVYNISFNCLRQKCELLKVKLMLIPFAFAKFYLKRIFIVVNLHHDILRVHEK